MNPVAGHAPPAARGPGPPVSHHRRARVIAPRPAARRLACVLAGFAAAPVFAGGGDGARRPLLAPRPAARVRIASPAVGVTRLVSVVEAEDRDGEKDRPASAKPEIGRGPRIFTGPRPRVAAVRRIETVPAPLPKGWRKNVDEARDLAAEDDPDVLPDGGPDPLAVADAPEGLADGAIPDRVLPDEDLADLVADRDGTGLVVARTPLPPPPEVYESDPVADAATAPGRLMLADRRPRPVVPVDPLAAAADEAIEITAARLLTGAAADGRANTPWQIGHGVMALRENYEVLVGGRRTNALEWLATGPTFKGEGWFERGRFGPKGHPYSGTMYDFEGHPNQILAFLSMSDLPEDFTLRDGFGRPFTIRDWIETAKREVRVNPKEEVTWTLWAFSRYLEPDAQWVNARRDRWSMERLVAEETRSRTEAHACGGTHGLYALASACDAYVAGGRRLRGTWLMAREKVDRYARTARALQNPDGSLSHAYFKQRGHSTDVVARIGSNGHTLEFLMAALPDRELSSPWVRAAVGRVTNDLLAGRTEPIGGRAVGGMYHAVHALVLYRERTGETAAPLRLQTAEGDPDRVVR